MSYNELCAVKLPLNIMKEVIHNIANIANITNIKKLNMLLGWMIDICTDESDDREFVLKFIKSLNPLILNKQFHKLSSTDPLNIKFTDFTKLFDGLKHEICPDEYINDTDSNIRINPVIDLTDTMDNYYHDFTGIEPLFKHNNVIYYGKKEIVYGSMHILKDMLKFAKFTELIELEGEQPKYVINMYIQASYNKIFLIDKIKPEHMIPFIKFIDQYPSEELSINKLEYLLVNYFKNNNLIYDSWMKDLSIRYQLRYMYICTHNQTYCENVKIPQ